MLLYHYDKQGNFVGVSEADPHPIRQGEYIIPYQATTIVPPEESEGKQIIFKDGAWHLEEIHQESALEPTPEQELAKLNAEFEPQFRANDEAYLLALRNNDQELIEELNQEKADLVAEYTRRKEVIFNGN